MSVRRDPLTVQFRRLTRSAGLQVARPNPRAMSRGPGDRFELLYEISQRLNSTLELDEVLETVIEQVLAFTGAQRGFVLLCQPGDDVSQLSTHCATLRNLDTEELDGQDFHFSRSVVSDVLTSREPELTLDAASDSRYASSLSVQREGIRAVMCAPLQSRDQFLGVIYVDTLVADTEFDYEGLDMLAAFANLAAMALLNARLFSDLRTEMMQNLVMKNYQWAILHSVHSGIVAVDHQLRLTTVNRAARDILGLDSGARGQLLSDVLAPQASSTLTELLQPVLEREQSLIRQQVSLTGQGADLFLRVSVSPLREPGSKAAGATLILEDITRQIESDRERSRVADLFGRLVSREVMQELLKDTTWQLGGVRQNVTVLLVDINNFSSRCENLPPGRTIELLNNYFEVVNREIFKHRGLIKQFAGDEILVLFGAPQRSENHAQAAVRTALDIIASLQEREQSGEEGFYDVKIGVHTGDVVVGHVGSEERFEYAAVGDAVNLASRIMGLNKQLKTRILISETTRAAIADELAGVSYQQRGRHRVKGRVGEVTVYEVGSG